MGPSPGWPSTLDLMSSTSYKPIGFESVPLYLKPNMPQPNPPNLPMLGSSASPLHAPANAGAIQLGQLPAPMDRDSIPLAFLAKGHSNQSSSSGMQQQQQQPFSIPAFLGGNGSGQQSNVSGGDGMGM